MNNNLSILPDFDKIDAFLGAIVSILTYILGEHWILFALFLALNVADYITGSIKAKVNGKINSKIGSIGIIKKFGYWIMILISFGASSIFIEIGEIINVNLSITKLLGWFVLATLIINELRSILENFVEAGFVVPKILTKGLEVAEKAVDEITNIEDGEDK